MSMSQKRVSHLWTDGHCLSECLDEALHHYCYLSQSDRCLKGKLSSEIGKKNSEKYQSRNPDKNIDRELKMGEMLGSSNRDDGGQEKMK